MGRGAHGGHGHSHGGSSGVGGSCSDPMEGANTFTRRLIVLFGLIFAFTIYACTFAVSTTPSPRPLADFNYCEEKNAELVRQLKLYEAQIEGLRGELARQGR